MSKVIDGSTLSAAQQVELYKSGWTVVSKADGRVIWIKERLKKLSPSPLTDQDYEAMMAARAKKQRRLLSWTREGMAIVARFMSERRADGQIPIPPPLDMYPDPVEDDTQPTTFLIDNLSTT